MSDNGVTIWQRAGLLIPIERKFQTCVNSNQNIKRGLGV